jgi:hypothetical protein
MRGGAREFVGLSTGQSKAIGELAKELRDTAASLQQIRASSEEGGNELAFVVSAIGQARAALAKNDGA